MSRSLSLLPLLFLAACAGSMDGESSDGNPTCEEVEAVVAECFPEEAETQQDECTEDTRAAFAGFDGDCSSLDKADTVCGENQRVCYFGFACCDIDRDITIDTPGEAVWDIVGLVDAFASDLPAERRLENLSEQDLSSVKSYSYVNNLVAEPGGEKERLAIEYTAGLIDVDFDSLDSKLCGKLEGEDMVCGAQAWGISLRHHLGGELRAYEPDSQGRQRQLERMVISNLPHDYDKPLLNNDMTKVEVIDYNQDSAKVYWRVVKSVNLSTITDIGYVEFSRYDEGKTAVVFHSGHRLSAVGIIEIDSYLLAPMLEKTFTDFISGYQQLVR